MGNSNKLLSSVSSFLVLKYLPSGSSVQCKIVTDGFPAYRRAVKKEFITNDDSTEHI